METALRFHSEVVIKRVCSQIAALADLSFSDSILVELTNEFKKGAARQLADSGLADREYLIREFRFDPLIFSSDGAPAPISSDILGEYLPVDNKVVIYSPVCNLVASSLGLRAPSGHLRAEALYEAVLAHGAAHAVTHLGTDAQKRTWSDYEAAPSCDQELFAQAYALKYLEINGRSKAVEVFKALADRQCEKYNLYKKYANRGLELNRDLLRARTGPLHQGPDCREIPREPEAPPVHSLTDVLNSLEAQMTDADWLDGATVADRFRKSLDAEGRSWISSTVSVIPGAVGECRKCLLVIMDAHPWAFKERLDETVDLIRECSPAVEQVVFWTPLWNSIIWQDYAPLFSGINVQVNMVKMKGAGSWSLPLPLPNGNVVGRRSHRTLIRVSFAGRTEYVDYTYDVLACVVEALAAADRTKFDLIAATVKGAKNLYASRDPQEIVNPRPVEKIGYYITGKMSLERYIYISRLMIEAFGLDPNGLVVQRENEANGPGAGGATA